MNRRESELLTLRARYVFPIAGPPICDGAITILHGRIAGCGPFDASQSSIVRDLGNVAILPGLVNAHAHLDFSDLREPLGRPGMGFADWIRLVMQHRRASTVSSRDSVLLGLQESLRSGVTTLGDIVGPNWSADAIHDTGTNVVAFRELLAPTPDRVRQAMEGAEVHIEAGLRDGCAWRPGLSPHAPYSVHPDLLAQAVELSATRRVPLAMHLAESREELELLRHGTGPLRSLLQDLGANDPAIVRPGRRPLDFLHAMERTHRALVVHGNYLDDEEISLLAARADRMAVVYCPQTHAWFAHDAYPLEKMLAAGVNVALGTDGRGSSPDLSLWTAMRLAARRHPCVRPDRILQMATTAGAQALGLESLVGSLEPGKRADLVVVGLPERFDAADPHELLFDSDKAVAACYCCGEEVYSRSPDLPNRRPSSSSTSVSETPQ